MHHCLVEKCFESGIVFRLETSVVGMCACVCAHMHMLCICMHAHFFPVFIYLQGATFMTYSVDVSIPRSVMLIH
jgi:hypothetical protein